MEANQLCNCDLGVDRMQGRRIDLEAGRHVRREAVDDRIAFANQVVQYLQPTWVFDVQRHAGLTAVHRKKEPRVSMKAFVAADSANPISVNWFYFDDFSPHLREGLSGERASKHPSQIKYTNSLHLNAP